MRVLTERLRELDVWTPSDIAEALGVEYKSGLSIARRLPHVKAGHKYLVAKAVVLARLGLDPDGSPRSEDD